MCSNIVLDTTEAKTEKAVLATGSFIITFVQIILIGNHKCTNFYSFEVILVCCKIYTRLNYLLFLLKNNTVIVRCYNLVL